MSPRRDTIKVMIGIALGLGVSNSHGSEGSRDRADTLYLTDFFTAKELEYLQTGAPEFDCAEAFERFAAVAKTGLYRRLFIPPGVYPCSKQILIESPLLLDLDIECNGALVLVTAPTPEPNKRYFSVVNTARSGRNLRLSGLSIRHNRPVGRVANTDMVRLAGFSDYHVSDVIVGSSDNMGITVGRGDPKGFTPNSVSLFRLKIGGHRERTPHEYASIGDSGIWVVNAPSRCLIIDPVVRETGDDGILVGETVSSLAGNVSIRNANVSDCGGNGICVSVPRGEITGVIRRTNQSGVALQKLQSTQASDFKVSVLIEDAGRLRAGVIGKKMIPKWNPWGVWIYQAEGGGNIDLSGTHIVRSFGAGINIQTLGSGSWGGISGAVKLERIAEPDSDGLVFTRNPAALRRSSTGGGTIVDVDLNLELTKTSCAWIWWAALGPLPDSNLKIKLDVRDDVVADHKPRGSAMIFFLAKPFVPRSSFREAAVLVPKRFRSRELLFKGEYSAASQVSVDFI